MPISPEEHNQKRRATKQKQRANARAAAAHKRRKGEDNTTHDVVVESVFSQTTISNMNRNHFVQKSGGLVSERSIYKMVTDGEIFLDVIKDETIFYPREIRVTRDGFVPVDGKELPLTIKRMKVVLGGGANVVFNYRYNKSLDRNKMEIGYEFKVPEHSLTDA